jgi:RNA polymerase sigma-70 factor (ECF subfamily)
MDGANTVLPDEQALVARAAAEPTAFTALYNHYFPRVYNYVIYRVGDSETAYDLTAQIFERVLMNIDRYRPDRASFRTWLFTIARNTMSNYFSRQRQRRRIPFEVLGRHSSEGPQPEEYVIRNETYAELLAAVARLSQRERDLIALKFAAGLTNRAIAKLTGLSESNVGVILFRAIRKLRAELSPGE